MGSMSDFGAQSTVSCAVHEAGSGDLVKQAYLFKPRRNPVPTGERLGYHAFLLLAPQRLMGRLLRVNGKDSAAG
jgi:hypothetical protein